ncbi:MAG: sugar phosphate isomerase/epimerase [Candidatus Glassbacteria bacterium]|nr:sugar phosphate isomerase/epimerase [Candidatus Glassbacteria bacterium]
MSERGMDRRDFLQKLGLTGLVLGVSGSACGGGDEVSARQGGASAARPSMSAGPKVGLCTIAFQELPFQEVLQLAHDAGIDGIEPWGKPDHLPLTRTDDEVRQARDAIEAQGLEVSHYGCYVRLGEDLEREKVSQVQKEANMARAVQITKLLGTDICRIWAGNKDSELLGEDDWERMVGDGNKFCALAEDAGITLAIEMHGNSVTNKAAAAVELLERVGSPALKLNYQILNNSEDPYERARTAGPHVVMVHAQNTPMQGRGQALICEGAVDFQKVWDILHGQFGFEGYFEIEFVGGETPEQKRAALEADAKCLKGIG